MKFMISFVGQTMSRYLAFLAFLAAMQAWIFLAPSTAAALSNRVDATNGAVRVLDESFEISFGSNIRVTLRAESNSDITAVKGWFKPRGQGRISSYAYADFTPGSSITATFAIRTGNGAYYPPGTEFDYRFELTDANGVVTHTPTRVVEYLDPELEWKRMVVGSLTGVYYNLSDAQVRSLLVAASARLPDLLELTGADASAQFKAVLYRSVADATPSFPSVSQTATDRQFFAGFAEPEYGLFVLGSPGIDTFTHELTHLLVAQVVSSPLAASVPAWLNEGLAVWSERSDIGELNARIRSAAAGNRLLKLRSMSIIPGRSSDISLFYPQSGAFVGYLSNRYGPDKISTILRSIDAGMKVYEAVEAALNVSLDQIENEWRLSIGASVLPVPTLTPELVRPQPTSTAVPLSTDVLDGVVPLSPTPDTPFPTGPGDAARRSGPPVWAYAILGLLAVSAAILVLIKRRSASR